MLQLGTRDLHIVCEVRSLADLRTDLTGGYRFGSISPPQPRFSGGGLAFKFRENGHRQIHTFWNTKFSVRKITVFSCLKSGGAMAFGAVSRSIFKMFGVSKGPGNGCPDECLPER